ncbi:MAG: Rrf2 family transcriptional regulator [Phycisphaerales bacterium]|nr:MAG: Rrf2 family transcriptional regulator [Phycisphaerales bacterium]
MLFSKTMIQGVYVLCHLSRKEPGTVVPAGPIAEAMSVPPEQTAKILQALARAGVVRSVRGRRGGYALAKPPEEITIGELVDALGPEEDEARFESRNCPLMPDQRCKAYFGLRRLHGRVRGFLGTETLAPLIADACDTDQDPAQCDAGAACCQEQVEPVDQ